MYKTMVIFGTRPEVIKLFSVINALKLQRKIACEVLVTAQHREMLDQVLSISGGLVQGVVARKMLRQR